MADEWREALDLLQLQSGVYSAEALAHNRWLTSGIWTITSGNRDMVLKCLTRDREQSSSEWDSHWTVGAEDPSHWNYWAREGLAYRHGLVKIYEPAGISAPEVIAAYYAEDVIVLLLDHVDGLPGDQWAVPQYASASRSLGEAHGHLLVEEVAAEYDWLSEDFLRDYSSEKAVDWALLDSDEAWSQPLVKRNFPPELRREATWLHAARGQLYGIASALPRVLSHLDFWTKNLILRHDGSLTLVDWAFAGDGAVGEDVGNLIPDAAFDHFIESERLPELEAAVRDAYLQGLADAGWDGDARLAELGMCAAAIKYDWLTPWMLSSASEQRQMRYGGAEEVDPDFRFRERGISLLDNALRARRAIRIAEELAA